MSTEAEPINSLFIIKEYEAHPTKVLYSVKEASIALGVSVSSVWRLLADGKLIRKKIRGRTVIPAASLRAFADGL
ncbi:helix-turn-helix domain-containing protein [uncultured Roseibium sp.]|uniref:helix-turn-helix domain-containing protein n=1 Tax=uncultured Roseibium sp. TaxID=1936171 RepID=UPI0032176120